MERVSVLLLTYKDVVLDLISKLAMLKLDGVKPCVAKKSARGLMSMTQKQ